METREALGHEPCSHQQEWQDGSQGHHVELPGLDKLVGAPEMEDGVDKGK